MRRLCADNPRASATESPAVRTNLPVTETEFRFPAEDTLVSTTDLKGRITHCNASFVAVSGYERDELLGQPHNLIRHPEMPAEAFRDMWATIASGSPWSAMVKNRRKNGDHYWVVAHVSPLMDGDQPTGYISVRTAPSRAQIEAAQALYRRMKADEVAGGALRHRLAQGELQTSGAVGRLGRALHTGPQSAQWLGLAALATLSLALGHWAAGAGWQASALSTWLAPGLACAAAAALHALLGRRQRVGMARLIAHTNRMAAGDLTPHLDVQGRGDTARLSLALNQLCVNIRAVVGDTRCEAQRMYRVTGDIASGNQELSARTDSQASSLEETASSMEQITGTVRQSAHSAQQASALASSTSDITQRCSEAVHGVTQTMHAISDSSQRIGDIIQVIESIAFQTNMLALNAAVEAARAGEQGRGFAVVAAEVRALSQRTSTAAKEVRQLILAAADTVGAGTQQTAAAQATMQEALAAVQQVSRLIGEIHTGATEQLLGISQVNEAVSHLDGITQQNSAMVDGLASSAVTLHAQAQALVASVQIFKVGAEREQAP
ncbi:MAG: hypothetical protein RJA98_2757 [Pseudomonadota bacterium]